MNSYSITGMNCSACSNHIEQTVKRLPGVTSCEVSLITGIMNVTGSVSQEAVIRAVTELGYGITVSDSSGGNIPDYVSRLTPSVKPMLTGFLISLVLLLILMYLATGHLMFGLPAGSFFMDRPDRLAYTELILTSAILLINGRLLIKGYRGLVRMMPTMDTLVAIGVSASYLYSVQKIALLNTLISADMTEQAAKLAHNLYFESAAMLLVIVVFGKILERSARGKTTTALRGLLDITPKNAHRIRAGAHRQEGVNDNPLNAAEDVPAAALKVNDVFIVLPGESIPADAVIIEGSGSINESGLTGESMPRDVTAGDTVTGATVNINGLLKCRALRTGSETVFSKMVETVKVALTSKAPISRTADTISAYFVPAVIVLAILTFCVWYFLLNGTMAVALEYATAVLLVSCPCALGLATPLAITAGAGKALRNGVLFKNAESLEKIGRVKYMVLDKTGTITAGTPKVTSVITVSALSVENVLHLAGILESFSSHPVAKAVAAESGIHNADTYGLMDEGMNEVMKKLYSATDPGSIMNITEFAEVTSGGVHATINGHRFFIGNQDYIRSKSVISADIGEICNDMSNKGDTTILLATEREILGIISVSDVIRDNAAESVALLYRQGITPIMLTGDNIFSASGIAEKVHIRNLKANCLPEDKAQVIRELRGKGVTAMVGDGINDALPLTEADIGIAVASGSDIAIDAGNVVLVKNTMLNLVKAIRCGRRTLRTIKENLFWALCYNIVGLPLAAGALSSFGLRLTPVFAASCMAASSLIVVGNSLRIFLTDISEKKLTEDARNENEKISAMGEAYFRPHLNVITSDRKEPAPVHKNTVPTDPVFSGFMGITPDSPVSHAQKNTEAETPDENMVHYANLIIDGMVCEHCESTVCEILRKHVNIINIVISHRRNAAVAEYRGNFDEATVKRELSLAGYNLVNVFNDSM